MGFALYSATNSIGLDLERNFSDNRVYNIQFYNTLGGNVGEYKYGDYRKWGLNIQYLTSSEAMQINEWQMNATDLNFKLDTGSSYNVRILNDTQPAKNVQSPYYDKLSATINLTEFY